MKIALINKSSQVSGEQLAAIAEALEVQANEHFAPIWGTPRVHVQIFERAKEAPSDAHQMLFLDKHGDEGDEGYHTTTDTGAPYSKILVEACIDAGGGVLMGGDLSEDDSSGDDDSSETDADTISATASHELLEMLADPACDQYRPGPAVDNKFDQYSVEVCDPVQESAYTVTLKDGETEVTLSNFITKSWFESSGEAPYDYLKVLQEPFAMAGGGYIALEDADGNSKDIFDNDKPPAAWRQAARKHPAARGNRRKGND